MEEHTRLSVEDMVKRHSDEIYQIYFIGFLPGFPYLGQLNPSLHTPRLRHPRAKIPQGSVGVGGQQTGIYPTISPGGWNIIGRTPLRLFDPEAAEPSLLKPGDQVQFQPISEAVYKEIEAQTAAENYSIIKSEIAL